MNRIVRKHDEEYLTWFIKDLLSLANEGRWAHTTVNDQLVIEFKGDIRKVQKEIFRWLSLPERRKNFEL